VVTGVQTCALPISHDTSVQKATSDNKNVDAV